jgi:peptide deformylase
MAVRKTLQLGHPKLTAKNSPIKNIFSTKTQRLINDLKDTMRKNELVGIAAPQIGENNQIFVTEIKKTKTRSAKELDELRVFINPKITNLSKEESIIYEGCGSVVNGTLFGPVKRPKEITVEAIDKKGRVFQLRCDGILARVIQHEFDHLQGIMFTEKVSDYTKLIDREFYKKNIKKSPLQISNSKITLKEFKYL